MQRCDRTTQEGREEYTRLEAQLQTVLADKSQAKAQIQSVNQFIGEVSRVYRSKTGRDMDPIDDAAIEAEAPRPATGSRPTARPTAGTTANAAAHQPEQPTPTAETPSGVRATATAAVATGRANNPDREETDRDRADRMNRNIAKVSDMIESGFALLGSLGRDRLRERLRNLRDLSREGVLS